MPKAAQKATDVALIIPSCAAVTDAPMARRSFLTGLAVSLPAAAIAATPALAGTQRSEIDILYEERTVLAARSRKLAEQYAAAEASMPWWAQGGYGYLCGDGTWTGAFVGWPATDDIKALNLMPLLKRPSPWTFRKEFESYIRYYGEERRPEFRATYRRQMRDLVARLRCQREEQRKVGLQQLRDQLGVIGEPLSEIDERIESLSVTSAAAAQKAAAMILITSPYNHWRSNDEFGNTATLVALQPFLTGQIREHVDYVIENPDCEMSGMLFYSAA
jgi:hypothetical protein